MSKTIDDLLAESLTYRQSLNNQLKEHDKYLESIGKNINYLDEHKNRIQVILAESGFCKNSNEEKAFNFKANVEEAIKIFQNLKCVGQVDPMKLIDFDIDEDKIQQLRDNHDYAERLEILVAKLTYLADAMKVMQHEKTVSTSSSE